MTAEHDYRDVAAHVLISKHYNAYLLSFTSFIDGEEENWAFGSLVEAKRYARRVYEWAGKADRSWEEVSETQWRLSFISEESDDEEESGRGAFDGMFSIDHA